MSSSTICPLITVHGGESHFHGNSDEIKRFFFQLLVWFRGIEHGTASISDLDVRTLGDKSAFVNLVWKSARADGTAFLEWPTAYQLAKPEDDWKILAIIFRYEPAQETSLI
jgi:hypothetical protein